MAPCDANAIRAALTSTIDHPGPTYFRVGRGREAPVYNAPPDWRIGGSTMLRQGRHTTIFAISNLVHASLEAAAILAPEGIELGVVDCYSIRPLDEAPILAAAHAQGIMFAAEEHNVTNGFGSAVAEVLALYGTSARLVRIGCPPTHLYRHYGLDGKSVARTIRDAMKA